MRILIATGIYPPDIGGPATYSKVLFDELPKNGIDTEILSFGEVRHLPKGISHISYFFQKFFQISLNQDYFGHRVADHSDFGRSNHYLCAGGNEQFGKYFDQ